MNILAALPSLKVIPDIWGKEAILKTDIYQQSFGHAWHSEHKYTSERWVFGFKMKSEKFHGFTTYQAYFFCVIMDLQ